MGEMLYEWRIIQSSCTCEILDSIRLLHSIVQNMEMCLQILYSTNRIECLETVANVNFFLNTTQMQRIMHVDVYYTYVLVKCVSLMTDYGETNR